MSAVLQITQHSRALGFADFVKLGCQGGPPEKVA